MIANTANTSTSYPLVIKHGMENPLEMEVSIGTSPMDSVFSIAMFDYRRVNIPAPKYLPVIVDASSSCL